MREFAEDALGGDMPLTALHAGVGRPARLSMCGLFGPVAAGATFASYAHFPPRGSAPATLASQVEHAYALLDRGQLVSAVAAFRAALETQRAATGGAHPAELVVQLGLLHALAAVAAEPGRGTMGHGECMQLGSHHWAPWVSAVVCSRSAMLWSSGPVRRAM